MGALLHLLVLLGGFAVGAPSVPDVAGKPWTVVEGGVGRGDLSSKPTALISTGGDLGEGAIHVLDTLKASKIKASFFLPGDYLHKPELQDGLKRMVAEGPYLGPHSDSHPLYCPWEDRSKT